MKCDICYEDNQKMMEFRCSHQFCFECVRRWFRFNNTCPSCRCIIEPKLFGKTRANKEKNQLILFSFLRLLIDNDDHVWLCRGLYVYEILNKNACFFYTNPTVANVISEQNKEIKESISPYTKNGRRMMELVNVSNELYEFYKKK